MRAGAEETQPANVPGEGKITTTETNFFESNNLKGYFLLPDSIEIGNTDRSASLTLMSGAGIAAPKLLVWPDDKIGGEVSEIQSIARLAVKKQADTVVVQRLSPSRLKWLKRFAARISARETAAVLRMRAMKKMETRPKPRKHNIDQKGGMERQRLAIETISGIALTGGTIEPFAGVQSDIAIGKDWLIGSGLRLGRQNLEGAYHHPSFSQNPPGNLFQIIDARRLTAL